jgi:hypothetical protein
MNRLIALFHSTRGVIRGEKICKQSGILCKVIPVPREFSSECGMALDIDPLMELRAKELIANEQLVATFHLIPLESDAQ